ncbi:metal dependent phosphohydrolase [Chloroherpeton thalassium ATCC 35110]|uniref:Metal dependent phosphohydrolase n=1 Tax=Chloroherpeton thalassium (strain ATCC 35110 / GB-78) TaxID=517418 RepID=B3QU97_CHLT3|nr:HD domain-containing phosphohydrolase [Chloroherpeton thalassium]ACF14346.1 metal dependent phosphohydrolase [Chloroherpeton thalassium ATCC 35110]
MTSAVRFYDFVGLELEYIDKIFADFSLENTFESGTSFSSVAHTFSLHDIEDRRTVLFLSLSQMSDFFRAVPFDLRKKIDLILVAWPEELLLYGDYTELFEKYGFFEVLEQPIKVTSFSMLLKKLELHWKNHTPLQASARQELHELKTIHEISLKLSGHREIRALLKMVRDICEEVTGADSVCVYLVVEREGIGYNKENYLENKQLQYEPDAKNSAAVFSESHETFESDSQIGYAAISLKTVPGYVAMSQQVLHIKDAYHLPHSTTYTINKSFESEHDYRTKSMLVVPIISRSEDKHTIGVVQLANKKINANDTLTASGDIEAKVTEFTDRDERLVQAVALHAGICLQSLKLYNNEQKLLEGFIKASVKAIESRDPTTSGHSSRVAQLVVEFAKAVSSSPEWAFRNVKYTPRDIKEIEYAALLHDFGKIGVRESVLVKANKLHPNELSSLLGRYRVIMKAIELRFAQKKFGLVIRLGKKRAMPILQELDKDCQKYLEETKQNLQIILTANAATHNGAELSDELENIKSKIFYFNESEEYEYLTDSEYKQLTLKSGTLSRDERDEIQMHVSHSFDFLRNIPWTDDLKQIPLIAYAHHERNDGSGYPNGLVDSAIPIPSKMMAIADIFDALTSPERPYKKGMSTQVALNILQSEADNNKIDPKLFNIFLEKKIYEVLFNNEKT